MILNLKLQGDSVQECLLNEMDWESLKEYKCDECDARATTSRRGFFDVDMGNKMSRLLVILMKIFSNRSHKIVIN